MTLCQKVTSVQLYSRYVSDNWGQRVTTALCVLMWGNLVCMCIRAIDLLSAISILLCITRLPFLDLQGVKSFWCKVWNIHKVNRRYTDAHSSKNSLLREITFHIIFLRKAFHIAEKLKFMNAFLNHEACSFFLAHYSKKPHWYCSIRLNLLGVVLSFKQPQCCILILFVSTSL